MIIISLSCHLSSTTTWFKISMILDDINLSLVAFLLGFTLVAHKSYYRLG